MFLSAVSLAIALVATASEGTQIPKKDMGAYQKVRKSMVILKSGSTDLGMGLCVDSENRLFLAHMSAIRFPVLFGRLSSGRIVELTVRAKDETTQLAILEANPAQWTKMEPLTVASENPKAGSRVFAVLPNGPISAEIVSHERLGVVSTNNRTIPLMELKFEASLDRVGGAPLFNSSGELLGILNATLPTQSPQMAIPNGFASGSGGSAAMKVQSANQYGPIVLTVGYALNPQLLNKSIAGFTSAKRNVEHATIGVFLAESGDKGAMVRKLQPGLAAEEAGMREGDLIIEISGKTIKNQYDFVCAMMGQSVGKPVEFKVKRNGETLTLSITPKS